ncbi:MAG TPA: polyketide cyclase [Xanthomonadaceae bacterium]|jgi:hypothetical protein|nr:polyketide cyclase [Xanthomonadaceae bacterium]
MARFLEFLVAILLVALLGVAVGLALPSYRTHAHSIETNRPINVAFDMLNGFQRFNDWNTMRLVDPNVKFTLSGPASGVGAKLAFSSTNPTIGSGSWEIVESVPGEKIVFRVEDEALGHNKTMRFTFERTGRNQRNVEVTKRYRVEYGWNLIGRYAGMYVATSAGKRLENGLRLFSNAMAGVPRIDYTIYEHPLQVVQVPAMNALKVEVTAPLANDGFAISLSNQLQWMERVVDASGFAKDGPLRIVTIERGSETYVFTMLQPVRDAEAPEGSSRAATVAELPVLEATIAGEGNQVVFTQTAPMTAANTKWVGPAPGLQRVRDTLRAWAMVRGFPIEPNVQGFDDYSVAIPEMLNPDAEFQAFLPLRIEPTPAQ